MRKLSLWVAAGVYVGTLVSWQTWLSVRTDEAKYLLNIPYPHPPFIRSLLALTSSLPLADIGWRIVFAIVLLTVARLWWHLGQAYHPKLAWPLVCLWLGMAGLLSAVGSIMLVVLVAICASVWLYWLEQLPWKNVHLEKFIIGLLWLVSLFSVLQSVLLLPLVYGLLKKRQATCLDLVIYLVAPVVLLGLYALGNPLIPAQFLIHIGRDAHVSLANRMGGLGTLLWFAGSGFGTVMGMIGCGILARRRPEIAITVALITLYIFISKYDYYAILLVPFFCIGTREIWHTWRQMLYPSLVLTLVLSGVLFWPLWTNGVSNHQVPHVLAAIPAELPGSVAIQGNFGHQWQFWSTRVVQRLTSESLLKASAIVCLDTCPNTPGFNTQMVAGTELRVRTQQ